MKRFLKYDTEITKKENSPVDKNGLIKENIVGGGNSVQPDWNQNDSTQPDYVKNRPFYTGNPVETVLVEEQTVAFSNIDGGYAVQGWPTEFDAVVGETYKVSWDGTEYECECLSMKGLPYIGNLAVAGAEIDTREPFIFMNQGSWVVGTNDTASEHSISVSSIVHPVTKIDEKYLPIATNDSIGVVKDNNYVFDLTKEQTKETVKEWGIIARDNRNNLFYDIGNGPVKPYKIDIDYFGTYLDIYDNPYACIRYKPDSNNIYKWDDGTKGYKYVYTSGIHLFDPLSKKTLNVEPDAVFDKNLSAGDTSNDHVGLGFNTVISDHYMQCRQLILKSISGNYYGIVINDYGIPEIRYYKNHGSQVVRERLLATTDSSGKELYINSSTADSTKKFKITVDDSGTITATEVT